LPACSAKSRVATNRKRRWTRPTTYDRRPRPAPASVNVFWVFGERPRQETAGLLFCANPC
jgi:hypothetical protein